MASFQNFFKLKMSLINLKIKTTYRIATVIFRGTPCTSEINGPW